MARYCTADDMRRIIGLSTVSTDPDYQSDSDLQWFIDKACTLMLQDYTILEIDESMSGDIDGTNTTFDVSHGPIADIDFDNTIGVDDVNVFGWGNEDDPSTKTSLTVSSVYPHDKKVVMNAAPNSTYSVLTATYRYNLSDTIRFELLPLANAYMAGWLFLTSEYLLIPPQYAVGAQRYKFNKQPFTGALEAYYTVMNMVKTKKWTKKQHDTIKLLRG